MGNITVKLLVSFFFHSQIHCVQYTFRHRHYHQHNNSRAIIHASAAHTRSSSVYCLHIKQTCIHAYVHTANDKMEQTDRMSNSFHSVRSLNKKVCVFFVNFNIHIETDAYEEEMRFKISKCVSFVGS